MLFGKFFFEEKSQVLSDFRERPHLNQIDPAKSDEYLPEDNQTPDDEAVKIFVLPSFCRMYSLLLIFFG